MARKLFWFLFATIALLALAPVLSVIVAGVIANQYGCILHEGFANPCVINGADRGETLYAMAVFGWLALATIPLGLIGLSALSIISLVKKKLRARTGTG